MTRQSDRENQNNCTIPFNNTEVLLILLVIGVIIYKLMGPMNSMYSMNPMNSMNSMNPMKSCIKLDLTSTPPF